jgi:hypothetical protein
MSGLAKISPAARACLPSNARGTGVGELVVAVSLEIIGQPTAHSPETVLPVMSCDGCHGTPQYN